MFQSFVDLKVSAYLLGSLIVSGILTYFLPLSQVTVLGGLCYLRFSSSADSYRRNDYYLFGAIFGIGQLIFSILGAGHFHPTLLGEILISDLIGIFIFAFYILDCQMSIVTRPLELIQIPELKETPAVEVEESSVPVIVETEPAVQKVMASLKSDSKELNAAKNEIKNAKTNIDAVVHNIQWDTLLRNAQDGGANSVLACRVLEKTAELLKGGSKQVSLMIDTAGEMKTTMNQLSEISRLINDLSIQARVLAFNAGIQAAHVGSEAKVFLVVADEMRKLVVTVSEMAVSIDQKIENFKDKITVNDEHCKIVGSLFSSVNSELFQFKNLMLRVEELAGIQCSQLKSIEEKFKTVN